MLSKGCVRRRRRSQSEIERLVQEFGASGLTQKEFAQQVGVHPLSVARWIRTTAVGSCSHGVLRDETTPASAPQFVKVRVQPTRAPMQKVLPVDWPEVVSPNGWMLRIPPGTPSAWIGGLLAQLPRC